MSRLERREIAYTIIAIMFMASILYLITFVHELGHVLAVIFSGGKVIEFNITPFNGGTIRWFYIIEDPIRYAVIDTVVGLSGGLAVSLFFLLLGFFKRPFLLIVPLHIIDGIAEVFQMGGLHSSMTQLTALFVAIIINYMLYVKLWRNE